ncbi:outer membrane beta-barrel protein [Neiella sp. HB171785]|uniref:Outer membrane beta-barrel protein n=1 Tax=Neiella litorisoli TaxID=2771431 RepID=A0A8J6UF95_9GAMM|nr:outer membrane beta-barrel protein [Neiella litorisoli]MBD1388606.1 outer membrane beta-barrel protein [Neiella litorisoli]
MRLGITPALALSLAFCSISATADYQPASFDIAEGLKFQPQLSIINGYDDNTAHSANDEVDSWFTVVNPQLSLKAGDPLSHFALSYQLNHARYHSSDEDDYTDHKFTSKWHHELTSQHRLTLNYDYIRDHEDRGTGISEGQGNSLDEVVERELRNASLVYGFGVSDARFNVDLRLVYDSKEYRNYRQQSMFRDFDTVTGGSTLYWRLGPKTSLLLDLSRSETEYDRQASGESNRDSTDQTYHLGVRWQATGKTTGIVKLGYSDRDYDDAARADFSGLTWSVGAEWLPKSYSKFIIESGRRAKDPDTLGDYVKETNAALRWEHGWSERLTTIIGAKYIDEEFTGLDRDDDYVAGQLGLRYDWRRWLRTDLNYQYSDQDSNIDSLSYDKSTYWLTLRAAL